jgi:hypothetical protein
MVHGTMTADPRRAVVYLVREKMTIGLIGLTGPIVAGIGDPALKRDPKLAVGSDNAPCQGRASGRGYETAAARMSRILDDQGTQLSRGRK